MLTTATTFVATMTNAGAGDRPAGATTALVTTVTDAGAGHGSVGAAIEARVAGHHIVEKMQQ